MKKHDKLWINSMEWCKKYCRCHQMPERSFFIKGYQFPLCARCTGIAIGHITAYIMMPFRSYRYNIAFCMVPLILDGTLQYFTPYQSNNVKRLISGILYGFSFTSITLRLIKTFFLKLFFHR